MVITELLEAVMVICFGLSWPGSILKSWKSRSNKGKSLFFLCMIAFGYMAGISWKAIEYRHTGVIRYPTVFYVINLVMILCDIAIYFRNRRIEA